MVLVATVTKAKVVCALPGLWNIVMHMQLRDGAIAVIDKDYIVELSEGKTTESKSPSEGETIESKSLELIEAMQEDIDQYKNEQSIFNNAELAALATTVKAGLEL